MVRHRGVTSLLCSALALGGLAYGKAVASAGICPNSAVRTGVSAQLPDCRGYEVVSPVEKNGADIMGVPNRTRAAGDGDAVQFASLSGFGDVRGTGIAAEYMSVRDGLRGMSGWATHAITPPHLDPLDGIDTVFGGLEPRYMGEFSGDLDAGVFLSKSLLTPGTPNVADVPNLYVRDDLRTPGPGRYALLSDCPACTAPLIGSPADQPAVAGASADFSHVIFESTQNLTADASGLDPDQVKLYEWANGTVLSAGILPDDECSSIPSPCPAPSSEAGQGALENSSVVAARQGYTPNTISQDGRRIFFTVSPGNGIDGQLYMRVDNDRPGAFTVRFNASERTDCAGDPTCGGDSVPDLLPDPSPLPARYAMATPDGTKVFFWTKQKLIDADTSDPNLSQLYRYDVTQPAEHRLTLVSPDTEDGVGADIEGVLGASDDGSYVYFISSQEIVSGESPGGHWILVWHDGAVHEVASIPGEDVQTIVGSGGWLGPAKASQVSPDGQHLVFTSRGTPALPHTGAGDACPDDGGCREVYLYDAAANGGDGRLTCASCNGLPSAPSLTDATFYEQVGRGGTGLTSHLPHPLSDDGRFVFFQTRDRLVPGDLDGTTPDVYEYDSTSGQVHLISSGRAGSFGANFLDASRDGHDVFFVTRDKLRGWDTDDQADLYDARINGGLPEPLASLPACTGTACRGGQSQPLSLAPPATHAFHGAGNLKVKAHRGCKRGRVRKRVHHRLRCVKRRHRHAQVRKADRP